MSLGYDLVMPRESLPLCAAHFRCGSRELDWHEDEAGFRAAWPYSCKPTLLNCLRVWWEANR